MKRREFFICGGAAVAWPVAARAQTPRAQRKIGFLHPESLGPETTSFSVSRSVWLRLGYVEGETVLLRARSSGRHLIASFSRSHSLTATRSYRAHTVPKLAG